jgi:hypothetical protein
VRCQVKYLTKEELEALSDKNLDDYARVMTAYQMKILAVMDLWVDAFNAASDEYDRRKGTSKRTIIRNDSETLH